MKTFNKDLLIAAQFTSKDETREALTGVYITDNHLMASDGYIAIKVERQGGDITDIEGIKAYNPLMVMPEALLLSGEDIKKVKFSKVLPSILCDDHEKDISLACPTEGRKVMKKLDPAEFPKLDAILDEAINKAEVITINVNAALLINALKAFVGSKGEASLVHIKITGAADPVLIQGYTMNNKNKTAMVMPCHG